VGGKADGITSIRASAQWAELPATVRAVKAVHILGQAADKGDAIEVY
jgi:hypothetical protein